MKYDAVIVGASFAGLSVAGQLKGHVLVIDKREIGAGQTSACATFLSLVKKLNCAESLLQEHRNIYIHTNGAAIRFSLPEPFCTFDYKTFCRLLAEQCAFDWLQAKAIGIDYGNNTIITDSGSFSGKCLIDASGWHATLATSIKPNFIDKKCMSFGIEAAAKQPGENLHFVVDPTKIDQGYGWIFPAGKQTRIGVCSYSPPGGMKMKLLDFIGDTPLLAGSHGGNFTAKMRQPTVNNLFVVGDAAGHCLPVTGEGIRTAIYFGEHCGRYVQQVIDGQISLKAALSAYKNFVDKHRRGFTGLRYLQKWINFVPNSWFTKMALWADNHFDLVMRGYTELANPKAVSGPLTTHKFQL